MCGLCGVIGPGITRWDIDALRDLTYVSGLRGQHSTGVLQGTVNTNYFGGVRVKVDIFKKAWFPSYFMWWNKNHSDGNRDVLEGVNNNLFACHLRHATKGKIIDSNAHPFEYGNIIGMHNGTLYDKKYQHEDKTDSELLIEDISIRGIKTVLEDLSPNSAYAIVIFNKETGELSFARNTDRTLYFRINSKRRVLYWASESEFIDMVAKRHDIPLMEKTYTFEPYKIYTIIPDDVETNKEEQWEITPYKHKTYVSSPRGGWGQSDFPFWPDNQDPIDTKEDSQKPKEENSKEKEKNSDKKSDKPRIRVSSKLMKHKVPLGRCCTCYEDMWPIDLFYGLKISDAFYICEKCKTEKEDNK